MLSSIFSLLPELTFQTFSPDFCQLELFRKLELFPVRLLLGLELLPRPLVKLELKLLVIGLKLIDALVQLIDFYRMLLIGYSAAFELLFLGSLKFEIWNQRDK